MPKQAPTPQPTPTPHDEPAAQADYLRSLLAQAPADVRTRLAEIGEITLSQENLAEMRNRQLAIPAPHRAPSSTPTTSRPEQPEIRTFPCGCTGNAESPSCGPA